MTVKKDLKKDCQKASRMKFHRSKLLFIFLERNVSVVKSAEVKHNMSRKFMNDYTGISRPPRV